MLKNHRFIAIWLCLAAAVVLAGAAGCSRQTAGPAPQPVEVKVMPVIQQDTPVNYEFVGQVMAKNEVQLRSRVSGVIVAKMVNGGDAVRAGQPLFTIDRRQYEAALQNARAQLAQAEAALSNVRLDRIRYEKLAAQGAISKQTLDTILAQEQQNIALVEANRAKVRQAEVDLEDTLIVAPFDGRIEINELSVGSFVQAGQTVLATISSTDPVFVQFSLSENEYLRLAKQTSSTLPDSWGQNLKLMLSDGQTYQFTGKLEQIDRGLAQNTGTLTLKASFPNPQRLLVPGMFARVVVPGEMRQGALLIPQRAVQEILGKTFVTVVAAGDKAELRPVKMGPRVGNLWLVEEGLSAADRIVVEGGFKVQAGTPLKVVPVDPAEFLARTKQ